MSTASIREVLACVDGSDLANGVTPHARAIAGALHARLTLLHVLETDHPGAAPPDPLDWGIRRREARAQLDDLVAEVGELPSGLRSELIQGRAAEQICGWAEQNEIDLTVLCSHGSRGMSDFDLASTARKLIERAPGSLLLIPAQVAAAGRREVRYRRILVPLDGSPRAESVVPVAMRIAAFHQAEVLFVHIVPSPEITRTGPLDADGLELERRVIERNERVARDYLDRIRARSAQAGTTVRALVVGDGSVRTKLESVIRDEEADLVVMSAHGHTGRTDSPCGSATEYVLTHATTPILIVRERQRRALRRVRPIARALERVEPPDSRRT